MKKQVLIQPIVTEKLSDLMEDGHYAFKVNLKANKVEIRRAIEARYPDVTVKEVRTMVVRGKRKRQQTRRGVAQGRAAGYKKAIITLSQGEIDFFEAV